MIEEDRSRDGAAALRVARPFGFGPELPALPSGAASIANVVPAPEDDARAWMRTMTAYRSVPATRGNLVPGALAFAVRGFQPHPASGRDAFDEWRAGVVDRVDWDLGFVYLAGEVEPRWISAARVAVLAWRAGGTVTVVGGQPPDRLAVTLEQVISPP